MKIIPLIILVLISSCSFVKEDELSYEPAKIIFKNMTITRYEKNKKNILLQAEVIETYPEKEILAMKNVYIVQYKNDRELQAPEVAAKASAKNALFLQKEKQYFFGGDVFLQNSERKLTIHAQNLFYNEAEYMLYAAVGEKLIISDETGTEISGTNFAANTLSQEFTFDGSVSGRAKSSDSGANEKAGEQTDDEP